jgi:hypothetical protein
MATPSVFLSQDATTASARGLRHAVERAALDFELRVVVPEAVRPAAVAEEIRRAAVVIVDGNEWRPDNAFQVGLAVGTGTTTYVLQEGVRPHQDTCAS